ncbi:MAG: molybdenum cofactor biosynthesis protein MoaE [Gemmatimonadales bacterium]|nr:molybdenum cofactor biosynthesis protein MoaE [Gemmatimonadales bacterium]
MTEAALDLGELLRAVQSPEHGGIACFLGTVRNHHGGREVLRLEYSAYGPMVEAECARIVAEAEARWQVAVALRHRIGRLEIGDTAVAVVAASAHRDEAFVACRHVIEELKRRVPIWKREVFADGTVEWVGSGSAGQLDSGSTGQRDSEFHVTGALGGTSR